MNNTLNYSKVNPYVEGIIEEHPNLHFIAFTDDCVLAVSPKTRKAHFFYYVNEETSFHFNLLSHCNDNATGTFQQIITDLQLHLGTEETATDYYNTLSQFPA